MKKSKKLAIGVLIGIGVLAISLVVLNNYLEARIKSSIEENLKKANATFEKVDVKLLDRTAEVINPFIQIKGKTLKVDTILLNDIHLWDYISNKDIIIGDLRISKPVVKFYRFEKEAKDSASARKRSSFKNRILIKKVNVSRGDFRIFEKDSNEHRLYTSLASLKMENVRVNAKTLNETVPFNYEIIRLEVDSIFYDLDQQHELAIGKFLMRDENVQISDFRIIPKYSKAGHQKTIRVEKDRYDLSIDSISFNDLNWSVQNDSLKFQNPFTRIAGVNFDIYRDKLPPDDNSTKPMYSKMIRQLPFLLQLDSIKIRDSYIRYEERIQAGRPSGIVEFSNLNGTIWNITNLDLSRQDFPETRVKARADFMKAAPLSIDWKFDISDPTDEFQISGEMGRLQAGQMNRFLTAAMNVEASGEILDMYFNFYGNNDWARGDMRLKYKDFKIEVLRKDGQRKNKVISALANLIVRNKAVKGEKTQKEINVERDKSKSFWNYFWNMVKTGAFKSFI
ncbi:hypothetical protein GCM10023115_29430 [Pontixanthobacter gangjinensis]|uniref:DUF748 domain-containing protein n=1 Tax=Christiangramia aestuarii TaxID=1028746 RepID=A0A7K1LMZ2_9FLAO|nr:hypothetical protein [Christiangramia aestuarii]MUP42175.1 hypothetical protein [Christiangramia aestuarii]